MCIKLYVHKSYISITTLTMSYMYHTLNPVTVHCKNEPVILTLIWLQEFQYCIDNKYYAYEV